MNAPTFATFPAFERATRALRLLDPACGSGSFLIRAFERVCEHWQRRFIRCPEDRTKELCWTDPATGDVHLTVGLKRQILRDNIYGVDLDAQAGLTHLNFPPPPKQNGGFASIASPGNREVRHQFRRNEKTDL